MFIEHCLLKRLNIDQADCTNKAIFESKFFMNYM